MEYIYEYLKETDNKNKEKLNKENINKYENEINNFFDKVTNDIKILKESNDKLNNELIQMSNKQKNIISKKSLIFDSGKDLNLSFRDKNLINDLNNKISSIEEEDTNKNNITGSFKKSENLNINEDIINLQINLQNRIKYLENELEKERNKNLNYYKNNINIQNINFVKLYEEELSKNKIFLEKYISEIEDINNNLIKYFQNINEDKNGYLNYNYDYTNLNLSLTKAESILEFRKPDEMLGTIRHSRKTSKFMSSSAWKPNSDLEHTLRDIVDLGSKFNKIKQKTANSLNKSVEELTNSELSAAIDKYGEALKNFVNKKSLIGLGIVMSIAVSMQTINRAITRKQFNAEGAPIYKDFGKKNAAKKMDENQKKEFFAQKLLAAAGMFTLAALSMMKKPTINMFQFVGKFPTLDQCRWIAAATFASRMLAAEDKNELRETTVRDMASFSGLYFLGDYAKKGAASAIEMFSKTKTGKNIIGEDVVLLNRKKIIEKPVIKESDSPAVVQAKYKIEQFINWIKNTDLKSAREVSSIKVRNLRNLCRVADITFSLTMLGILLPNYTRRVTERKVEEAKKQEEIQKKAILDFSNVENKNTPPIFKNIMTAK